MSGVRDVRAVLAPSRAAEVASAQRSAILVSVVVPTYREHDNLAALIERLALVRERLPGLEVVFMDDPSGDGSAELVASIAAGQEEPWVSLISREGPRGLSAAVLDGFSAARGSRVVVMDADLSHPPEVIPEMLAALEEAEMVVGSRYVAGGSTADAWGVFRWLNSVVATVLARPLTRVKDPMSGFFALRRADVLAAGGLSPIGYKIGLELIVKCGLRRVVEVPIHFGLRHAGESKLTLGEQVKYLRHLVRLYRFAMTGGRGRARARRGSR